MELELLRAMFVGATCTILSAAFPAEEYGQNDGPAFFGLILAISELGLSLLRFCVWHVLPTLIIILDNHFILSWIVPFIYNCALMRLTNGKVQHEEVGVAVFIGLISSIAHRLIIYSVSYNYNLKPLS